MCIKIHTSLRAIYCFLRLYVVIIALKNSPKHVPILYMFIFRNVAVF